MPDGTFGTAQGSHLPLGPIEQRLDAQKKKERGPTRKAEGAEKRFYPNYVRIRRSACTAWPRDLSEQEFLRCRDAGRRAHHQWCCKLGIWSRPLVLGFLI
jgi:hypothetical protein